MLLAGKQKDRLSLQGGHFGCRPESDPTFRSGALPPTSKGRRYQLQAL